MFLFNSFNSKLLFYLTNRYCIIRIFSKLFWGCIMFLNELSNQEAIAFLNLVENFAKVDKVFAKEEEELIKNYMKELNLNNSEIFSVNIDTVINRLTESSTRIKNIIFFELVGLALIDGEYEEAEIKFLNNLADKFNISKEKFNSFVDFFIDVKLVYDLTFSKADEKIKDLEARAEALI